MYLQSLIQSTKRSGILLAIFCVFSLPFSISAQSSLPSCMLALETDTGSYTTKSSTEVLLKRGETIRMTWHSNGAIRGERGNGNPVSLSGTNAYIPQKSSTYSYRFSNGSVWATCSVKVRLVHAEFTESTLETRSPKPTVRGTALGTKNVRIQIYEEGVTKPVYESKLLPVKKDQWKTKVTKSLKDGRYSVVLLGETGIPLNTILKDTLVIGEKEKNTEKAKGKIIVMSVPLLSGGVVQGGGTIALSYLQVINRGNEPVKVQGFRIAQNGSASTDTITQLRITDDSGEYEHTVRGDELQFKNRSILIPLAVSISPGQMRLFTIKASVSPSVQIHAGTQLKIDVFGIETNADIESNLPIRGVTWTFGI